MGVVVFQRWPSGRPISAWVGLCVLALWAANSEPSEAAVAVEVASYESIARLSEELGPDRALAPSRTAVSKHPESLALVLQYTELLVETAGVPGTLATLNVLRDTVPAAHLEYAAALALRLTGRGQQAQRRLGGVVPTCTTWLDVWARDYERLQAGVVDADSVETVTHRLDTITHSSSTFLQSLLDSKLVRFRTASPGTIASVGESRRGLRWTNARNGFLAARLAAGSGSDDVAENYYRTSFSLADSLTALRTAGLARSYLGLLLDSHQRYADATEVRTRAVEIFESLDDSLALAYALMGLGWDLDRTSSYAEAIRATSRAIELWEALGSAWGQTQAQNNLGVAHFNAGEWVRASECYERGLALATQTGNETQRLMILNNVALLEGRRGRPDRAVEIYREILELHRQRGDVDSQLDLLNNLGLACLSLGESEQARGYFQSAIDLAKERGQFRVAASTNLAMLLTNEGEFEQAAVYLAQARKESRRGGDLGALASALAWSGRVAQRQHDLPLALAYLVEADSLHAQQGSRGPRIPTLIRLATVELELGWHEDARQSAAVAARLSGELGVESLQAAAACVAALVAIDVGKVPEARESARVALDLWRIVQDGAAPSLDRSDIEAAFTTALRILFRCVEVSGESASPAEIVEILQFAMEFHTRGPAGSGIVAGSGASADLDSLRRVERGLRAEVSKFQRDVDLATPVETSALRLQLADVETALHACRREILRADSGALLRLPPPLPSLRQLRESAGDSTLLLSYVMGPPLPGNDDGQVLRIVLVAGESPRVQRLRGENEIRRRILLWSERLRRPAVGEAERNAERRMAEDLGDILMPADIASLARGRSLVIASDGALADLPFAALVVESSLGERRLIEVAAIERTESLAYWFESLQTRVVENRPSQDLVVCTMNQSQSDGSLTAIVRRSERISPQAISDAVNGDAPWPRARILHFDSHGNFDARRPWRSGLHARAPADTIAFIEPFLQQADLGFLDIDHDLITLAACETARAEDSPLHSSMQSFARGLQMAGGRAVLGTYWNVDSSVASWSTASIYRRLAAGQRLRDALRFTQLELLRSEATGDPFYWAPWSVMGDGAQRIPLEMRRAHRTTWLWFGLSTILLAIVALLRRRASTTSAG